MARSQNELGIFPYLMAGAAYIPFIGVLFGAIAIVWGIFCRKPGGATLAALGAVGICFTFIVYYGLIHFGLIVPGGVFANLRVQHAKVSVTALLHPIEVYKTRTGAYPESLKALEAAQPQGLLVLAYDMSAGELGDQVGYFYYRLADPEHYYLLGVGADGRPFTGDDILPQVGPGGGGQSGLLIKSH